MADKWFFGLYQLLSAGAKYARPTQAKCLDRFNKTEKLLLQHKCYLPLLQKVAVLGYQFNYTYLMDADFNNGRPSRFVYHPYIGILDIEHANELLEGIQTGCNFYSLEILAARVVRQNLYPNAWFAKDQLQLPQSLLVTHFEAFENTTLPSEVNFENSTIYMLPPPNFQL